MSGNKANNTRTTKAQARHSRRLATLPVHHHPTHAHSSTHHLHRDASSSPSQHHPPTVPSAPASPPSRSPVPAAGALLAPDACQRRAKRLRRAPATTTIPRSTIRRFTNPPSSISTPIDPDHHRSCRVAAGWRSTTTTALDPPRPGSRQLASVDPRTSSAMSD